MPLRCSLRLALRRSRQQWHTGAGGRGPGPGSPSNTDDGGIGRVEVQGDDVADLSMNWGSGDVEPSPGAALSRRPRNPRHGRLRHPWPWPSTGSTSAWRQRAPLRGLDDHPLHVLVADCAGLAGTRVIVQSVEGACANAVPPIAHSRGVATEPAAISVFDDPPRRQHDAAPERQRRALVGRRAQRWSVSVLLGESNLGRRPTGPCLAASIVAVTMEFATST